jgi:hypothetical protein
MGYERTEFQIPSARIQSVRRGKPGTTSVGDRASARLEPGIISFLETNIQGTEIPLGAGYQARFNVPFGVAATAAYALIAPMQVNGVTWTGYDVEIEWEAPANSQEALLAEATVTAVDPGLACFTISCRSTRGAGILTGRLRLRALRNDKTVETSLLEPSRRSPEIKPRLTGYSLLASVDAPLQLRLGCRGAVSISVATDGESAKIVTVGLELPPGGGLSLETSSSIEIEVPPHGLTPVTWTIRADRPEDVNVGQPWPVRVVARSENRSENTPEKMEESYEFRISIPDSRPRRVFYVLTEDCETFDGGPLTGNYGAASVLGNANNFMDPEDYRIQMIEKPDRLNEIAERHGARWTHFWCVPQRFAVDWASSQSATGEWPRIASDLDDSIRRGSVLHEYAPHIHFDYEPLSAHPPQPRLLYDAATDGILPNNYYDPVTNPLHQYHDWDGSGRGISYVKKLGDLTDSDSKAGSLNKSLLYLARVQANNRYPLVARTGGFDFGITGEDQAISTEAYLANGLRANSDARFTEQEAPRDKPAYWCEPSDRMREVQSVEGIRLVQMSVSRDTDFSDPSADNRWFTSVFENLPASGVHVISAITHAMFMRGHPDAFRSLEGGSFAGLDEHLAWVRAQYPTVEFATASEALVEFLDYYAPTLEAFVSAVLCGGDPEKGVLEYGVRLLAAGIRLDEQHPARVRITAPPLFQAFDVARLRVVADGEVLGEEGDFDAAGRPGTTVTLNRRPADLRLQVILKPSSAPLFEELFRRCAGPRYVDPIETARVPLFQARLPLSGHYSTDVLRLLINPIAGSSEPVGRRIHPWGVFLMGTALTAALERAGGTSCWRPLKITMRWRKVVTAEADVYVVCKTSEASRFALEIRDHTGDMLADSEVELGACQAPVQSGGQGLGGSVSGG